VRSRQLQVEVLDSRKLLICTEREKERRERKKKERDKKREERKLRKTCLLENGIPTLLLRPPMIFFILLEEDSSSAAVAGARRRPGRKRKSFQENEDESNPALSDSDEGESEREVQEASSRLDAGRPREPDKAAPRNCSSPRGNLQPELFVLQTRRKEQRLKMWKKAIPN
jgi:hypothetical protein